MPHFRSYSPSLSFDLVDVTRLKEPFFLVGFAKIHSCSLRA